MVLDLPTSRSYITSTATLFPDKIRSMGSRGSGWIAFGGPFLASHTLLPFNLQTPMAGECLMHPSTRGCTGRSGAALAGCSAHRDHRPAAVSPLNHLLAQLSSGFKQPSANLAETRDSSKAHGTEEEKKRGTSPRPGRPSPGTCIPRAGLSDLARRRLEARGRRRSGPEAPP